MDQSWLQQATFLFQYFVWNSSSRTTMFLMEFVITNYSIFLYEILRYDLSKVLVISTLYHKKTSHVTIRFSHIYFSSLNKPITNSM